ncbi:MAG TPA: hypothetical protein PKD86_07830, partial [Gemmatales bacterium]|nr:hypothetical protein [Gemmatales bacterium]
DAPMAVSADLSGKQTPCPECRRIVKVPVLEKSGPRDWRAPEKQKGPTGAILKESETIDAWSTSQAGKVSSQALLEAGVLKVPKRKVTARDWIVRGSFLAFGLVVLFGLYWGINRLLRGSFETVSLATIESYISAPLKDKLDPGAHAEMARLLAEYFWLYEKKLDQPLVAPIEGKKATRQFKPELQRARQLINSLPDPAEQCAAAAKLLDTCQRLQLDARELAQALSAAPGGPPRLHVLRQWVKQRLQGLEGEAAAKEIEALVGIVRLAMPPMPTGSGQDASALQAGLGILGQEAAAAGARRFGLELYQSNVGGINPKLAPPLPLLALGVQLGENLPEELPEEVRETARALGHAAAGQIEAAVRIVEDKHTTPTRANLNIRLEVAAAALAKDRLEDARKVLDGCREWIGVDRLPEAHWERFRWCELLLAVSGMEGIGTVDHKLLSGPALGRLRLEAFEQRLASDASRITEAQAIGFEPAGVGRQLAVQQLARLRARSDLKSARSWVDGMEEGPDKAFALLGLLLGQLDAMP